MTKKCMTEKYRNGLSYKQTLTIIQIKIIIDKSEIELIYEAFDKGKGAIIF